VVGGLKQASTRVGNRKGKVQRGWGPTWSNKKRTSKVNERAGTVGSRQTARSSNLAKYRKGGGREKDSGGKTDVEGSG